MAYLNYAFYHFGEITNPVEVRDGLRAACRNAASIKGTVLVTAEGLNAYFAGHTGEIDVLMEAIRRIPGCADLQPKVSESEENPFRKLIIKNRGETIGLGVPGLKPHEQTGKRLSALEFKQWMDRPERDFLLIDTRNDYEVEIGTFDGAINPGLKTFKDFPKWVEENLSGDKHKKIVTFCTGGIRCEKATAYMVQQGFSEVYQIDGGILKYLEQTRSDATDQNWVGDCFVFDYRVAVGKNLSPTDKKVCFACWSVLSPADLQSPRYTEGQTCPRCFEQQKQREARRQSIRAEKRLNMIRTRSDRSRQVKRQRQQQIQDMPADAGRQEQAPAQH